MNLCNQTNCRLAAARSRTAEKRYRALFNAQRLAAAAAEELG